MTSHNTEIDKNRVTMHVRWRHGQRKEGKGKKKEGKKGEIKGRKRKGIGKERKGRNEK